MIIFLFLFVSLATGLFVDANCGWTRQDVIRCAAKHIDLNKDGKISVQEVRIARRKYGGWTLRALSWVAGWFVDTSTEHLLRDCDADKDGFLEPSDFIKSAKTCLPTQYDLCMMKVVCDKADKMDRPKKSSSFWFI